MHVNPKPDESEDWAKRRVLDDLRFRFSRAERECVRLDLLTQMPSTSMTELHWSIAEQQLVELMVEIATTFAGHFDVPTAASVQQVSHETTGVAA